MKEISEKLREYFSSDTVAMIGDTRRLDEVRIKRGGRIYIRRANRNIPLNAVTDDTEFDRILGRMCKGSLYSFTDYIREGFIPLGDGFRAGVCGRAVSDGESVENVFPVESINIRIPHLIRGVSGGIYRYTEECKNVLIYAPPGEGKTTLLRDIALYLCDVPYSRRVCLIDSRCELEISGMESKTLLSVYSGYPKGKAVQLALRTMSPDYIICDEIGSEAEAEAILSCFSAGTGIIATAHAGSIKDVQKRRVLKKLCDAGVFDVYVGIRRSAVYGRLDFTVTDREEICSEVREYY